MSTYHSCGMRVFRGCRALLAPAKSSAADVANAKSTTSTTRAKPKPKPKPRPAKASNQGTGTGLSSAEPAKPKGILKVGPISPALQAFLDMPEASRSGAVKQIWSYIKGQNLQVPPTLLFLSLSLSLPLSSPSFTFMYGFVFLIYLRVLFCFCFFMCFSLMCFF